MSFSDSDDSDLDIKQQRKKRSSSNKKPRSSSSHSNSNRRRRRKKSDTNNDDDDESLGGKSGSLGDIKKKKKDRKNKSSDDVGSKSRRSSSTMSSHGERKSRRKKREDVDEQNGEEVRSKKSRSSSRKERRKKSDVDETSKKKRGNNDGTSSSDEDHDVKKNLKQSRKKKKSKNNNEDDATEQTQQLRATKQDVPFSFSSSLSECSKHLIWNCLKNKGTNKVVEYLTGLGVRPLQSHCELIDDDADHEDENDLDDDRTKILCVKINGIENLQGGSYISHPVVRVSIVDGSTGEYFLKKEKSCIDAVNNGERSSSILMEPEKHTKTIKAKRASNKCFRIPAQITQPCDIAKRKTDVFPVSWDHLQPLIFNIPIKHLLHPNALMFFEVLDFGAKIERKELLRGDGFYQIAWGFLKLLSATGNPNINTSVAPLDELRKTRIQLYKFAPDTWLTSSVGEMMTKDIAQGSGPHKVFQSFRFKNRTRYPSSLEVQVSACYQPEKQQVKCRPMYALEEEINNEGIDIDKILVGNLSKQLNVESKKVNGTDLVGIQAARRHRMKNEPCLVPSSLVCRLSTGNQGCFDVQFSPDGQYLAVATNDGDSYPIHIFDVATFSLQYKLQAHQALVYELAWQTCNPEEELSFLKLASASADGTVRIWGIPNIMLSNDGDKTARSSLQPESDEDDDDSDDESENLLEKRRKKTRKKKNMEKRQNDADLSELNDFGGAELLFVLQHTPPKYVYTVKFHPFTIDPPIVATGGYDGFVRLWDCANGELLGKLDRGRSHHKSHINASCFTNDGNRLVTGDGDGVVNIWRLETGRQPSNPDAWHLARKLDDPNLRGRPITSVQVHPVEKLLLVSAQQNVIRLFELRRYNSIHEGFFGAPVSRSFIRASFSPDGRFVFSGGEDGKPHLWYTHNGQPVVHKQWKYGFPKPLFSASWHPSEHLVAFCSFNGNFPVLLYEALRDTRDIDAKPIVTSYTNDDDIANEDSENIQQHSNEKVEPQVDEEENDHSEIKRENSSSSTKERTRRLSEKLQALELSDDEEVDKKSNEHQVKTRLKNIGSLRQSSNNTNNIGIDSSSSSSEDEDRIEL